MSSIQVRNKNHVVALDDSGRLVAEAKRDTPVNSWAIQALVDNNKDPIGDEKVMTYVAAVANRLDEVRQRKLVMAILKELV